MSGEGCMNDMSTENAPQQGKNLWSIVVSVLLTLLVTLIITGYREIRSDLDKKANKETVEVQLQSINSSLERIEGMLNKRDSSGRR